MTAHLFRRALAGLSALLVATLPAAAATAAPALGLPRPTGPYAVGTTWLHLTDAARADPWRPEVRRELMVSLWYPARPGPGPTAPYTTAAVSSRIVAAEGLPLPADVLTTVATNARRDVPVRPPAGRGWPLVVLSPGFSLSRESLTGLAEDLASRGYVVAGVDHPYEARGVEFPDGHVAGCLACELDGVLPEVVRGRAADVSFLLDRLTGAKPAWRGARYVDRHRIAAVGHSIGGASAAHLLTTDRRVDAAADLDGTLFVPVATKRPLLLVGADRPADASWVRDWPNVTGWKRWLTVAGAGHMSFTDRPVLGAQLGLDPGAIPAERQLRITRDYVAAFLDVHLRHRDRPLLDGPSPAFPEVTHRTGA
ncbi:lipase [Paractinoplanes abujensis]|uniref:Putative dienelactone hydrolase n=1 Tax=Paractinoplanes abujensis TaxID=882441 RepID=A0A7W7CTP1_9ACTN|nr:alpha/beta hydrolase [Actinoplanes abujensis]MBB4693185.1 putative dienelactone hydrolase [Actinoplanes abujensis]GID24385.1 lipase [Actinoplanes abujensis]